jgi:hypothetical protein
MWPYVRLTSRHQRSKGGQMNRVGDVSPFQSLRLPLSPQAYPSLLPSRGGPTSLVTPATVLFTHLFTPPEDEETVMVYRSIIT